jgi:type VI secretion system secreted protein VgrG
MSGKGWGSLSIPRPGQEVLVDFLQGDADYPIVVGSVYNGANLPPYDLPKLGHLHGFRSRTSAKTAQVNEIRFDDTYKQEQLYISAAYNYDIMVNNDCFETIGADRHLTVKKDMLCKIGNNQNEDIAADSTVKIGKDSSTNIMGKCISQVGGSRSLVVKGDSGENYEKNLSVKVNKDAYINASNVCIEASNNITFKVGDTYIAMERGGISIKSAGKIAIESKQNLSLESGAKTELSGKSATVIKGKSVKIN